MALLDEVDVRLQPGLRAERLRRADELVEGLPRDVTVVLAGQRAAGKSRLLQPVAQALGRQAVDLDTILAEQSPRPLREWIEGDERSFRLAEREAFSKLPPGLVIAVGGGFLSHHADLLTHTVTVEVPISFETYVERLEHDVSRPRLRPQLSVPEELRQVYAERVALHAQARPLPLVDFMLRLARGKRARRVVTLPPQAGRDGIEAEAYARRALSAGAEMLEVRSDQHPPELNLRLASTVLPLLISQRGPELPSAWRAWASLIDEPHTPRAHPGPAAICSLHAQRPLTTLEALAFWESAPPGSRIKQVEPLGRPADFGRVLDTQQALIDRFGPERVTVLVTGPYSLPFRAVLAERNAFDFLASDGSWAAAEGQRLLRDAVREARRSRADGRSRRLGIVGMGLEHSKSPRVHEQPFDRIDLPADAPLQEILDALHPHYRGLAITSPFKKRVAATALGAVNTLVREGGGWSFSNSDVAGAAAVLKSLKGLSQLTALGDGGVTAALRVAARRHGCELKVITRKRVTAQPLGGVMVWTWPAQLEVPEKLRFQQGAEVVVVAYGPPARRISSEIVARGGISRLLGHRWFIAQAREQRALWEAAP